MEGYFNNIMEMQIKKLNATISRPAHSKLIMYQAKNKFRTIDEALDKILIDLEISDEPGS